MKIKHVKGNVLRLEIPLTIKRKELVDGRVVEHVEDFYPCSDYPTYINFKKSLTIPFEASVQGNLARMQDNGTLNVGTYQIEVMCCDEAGNPYRYMVRDIVEVVDATADAAIEEGVEFNAETYTLEGAVFISYGVEQVQADWTETDIHSKAYINNKPTNLVEDENYVHTDNNYTDEEKGKLADLENYDDSGIRQELDGKVDKVTGKGLSTNDYTDNDKNKLTALPTATELTMELKGKANTKDLAPVATSGSYNDLSDKPDLSAFITKSVDNLVNYYLKSETYTKTEVQQLIGAIQQFHYEVYPSLPETGASNVLYLIGPIGTGADKYEEYVYANNDWAKIGDTSIDLSGYVTTEALTTALADYVTSSALSAALANYYNKTEVDEFFAGKANASDVYTKAETYNKTEVDNLITTSSQQYVSVTATAQTTAVTDLLPVTGEAATIYRVGNWDGMQYNDSVYSEYAWNGSAYIKLSTKSQVGEVYDISANHADTKYSNLAAALGADGANIPQSLRKGGMSIKFVQSSDNKYVQYRLMYDSFNTTPANWQGVDDEPTAGSDNLVKSGGVYNSIYKQQRETDNNKEYTGIEILGSVAYNYSSTAFKKNKYTWFNEHPTTIEGNVYCSFRNLEDCPYLQAGTYTFNKDYKGKTVFLYTNFSDLTSFTRITVNNNNEFTLNRAGYLRFLFSYEDIISEDGVLLINTNTSDIVYNITIPRRTFNEKIQAQTESRKQYKINATAVASKAWEQGELMGSLTIPAYHRLDFVGLRFRAGNCNIEIKDGTTTIESWNAIDATYEYDFLLLYNKDYYNGLTINVYSAVAQTIVFYLNAFYKGEKSVSDIVLSKRKPDMICASIYSKNTAPLLKAINDIEHYQLKSIFNATRNEQENEIVVAGHHPSGSGLFEVKAFDSNFIEKQFNPALNVVPASGGIYRYICRDRNRDIFWMVGDSLSDRGGYTNPNSLTYYSFAKEMVEKFGLLFSFCGNPTFGQTTAQQYNNLDSINTFIGYTSNIGNALAGNVVLRSDEIKGIYIYIGTNDIVQQTNLQTFTTNYNNLITLALTFTSSKIMVIVPSLCNKKANASDYCNVIKTICDENNIDYVDLSAVDSLDSNEHGQSDVYYEAECIHFTQHAWEDIINPLCMAKFQEVFADTITDAILKAEY